MDFAFRMAEEKMRQANEDGTFDNLPGKGKPLDMEDLSRVPRELQMGYKMLKNAGMVPEEVQLRKDMVTLQDLIDCCQDDEELKKLQTTLGEKTIRLNQLIERRQLKRSGAYKSYKHKIYNRLGG